MNNELAEFSFDGIATQNRLALIVWKMLRQAVSVPDIAATVASEFDMPRETALSQTRRCMEYFGQADFDCRRF